VFQLPDAELPLRVPVARAPPAWGFATEIELRAELARARGDRQQALVELESIRFLESPTALFGLAHFGMRERFLHAEMLTALGRDAEALSWYESLGQVWDLPYVAAAHLRRGEIFERRGDQARARFHYSRAASLWQGCDPEFQPLLARARDGLQRVSPGLVALSPASRESPPR